MIPACFRRIHIESSEHKSAYISQLICIHRLIITSSFFVLLYAGYVDQPIISQT